MAVLILTAFIMMPFHAFAASDCKTGECQYYKAEKSYNELKKNPKTMKRRDKWLSVIEEYKKVAALEPKGSFAAVGLYKTGTLYNELYKVSKNRNDLANAREYLEKAGDFKKSRIRFEAEQLLKALPGAPDAKASKDEKADIKESDKKTVVEKKDPKGKKLKKDSEKKTTEDKKLNASKDEGKNKKETEKSGDPVRKDDVKANDPKKNGKGSKNKKTPASADPKPDTTIKPDPAFPPVVTPAHDDRKSLKVPPHMAMVKGLRFGSLPTRTRIVIDTDKAVTFKHGILGKSETDPAVKLLYIDIKNSLLMGVSKSELCIDDERVKFLRASHKDDDTVRILVETKTYKDYKVFSLRSPSRVVVDVWGQSSAPAHEEEQDEGDGASPGAIIEATDLASQLHLGVKRIVIDPGHGGQDAGAPGFEKGVYEKDVVLAIGNILADKIRKELGIEVLMTRSDDTFITLEERTRIANKNKADLFISIHTNATLNKNAYGIETYFLNLARDKDSMAVAARENATSEKNISDLQSILDSLMRNTKITESSKLATYVQDSMVKNMSRSYDQIKSKGVKQAPFYVLLGARMPAILVETSFISNERECKRLTETEYQNKLCDSITDGIKAYIRKTSPMKDMKKRK